MQAHLADVVGYTLAFAEQTLGRLGREQAEIMIGERSARSAAQAIADAAEKAR